MADRFKLAQGLRNLPASAREDLAGREQDIQRGKTVELLRRAGKEMYDNPIVNTAIGFTPVLGDIQAAGETMAALNRGAPWQETAGYAAGMLPFVPMIGKTVWHGSPHTFDKFDLSKIGTGEGAQAYGHGLYFAESPQVAESYRSTGSQVPFVNKYPEHDKALFAMRNKPLSESDLKELMISDFGIQEDKAIKAIQDAKQTMNESTSLYKVDLPDEQIAKMLDYEKPFSQQNEYVQNALMNAPFEVRAGGDYSGADLYDMAQSFAASKVGEKNPAGGSALLNELGIPGIQYLDQASRNPSQRFIARSPQGGESTFNSAEEAQQFIQNMAKRGHEFEYVDPNLTRNYVVFSDEIPQILERNNQPVGMFK